MNNFNLNRARDALYSLPADCDHYTWVKIGMAAHAAGLDFADFGQWSATASNYNTKTCLSTWRRFKNKPNGIGAGTLFHMAREHGRSYSKARPKSTPIKSTRPPEPPRKHAPGMGAEEVWNRCKAVTNQHPYIQAKGAAGVDLSGLREVPAGDPVKASGVSMVGALVVPVLRPDGSLSSLHFIAVGKAADQLKASDKNSKQNLSGHSLEGWFTVGELTAGGTVYVVEGIGHAWAIWQATGTAAVVCFGSGRIGTVARELRQRDETARLVICPDRGKESDAQKIATEIGAAVACMPECEPNNFDVNDLFQRDGFDVVQALLEAAATPPKPEPKIHPLARFVDIGGAPKPPRWVIPGFIGHGVVVIAGAHGVGKTTALLPLAMTAAGLHGEDLLPHQWRHVVYITEDVEQARRILAGIVGYGKLGISLESVRERMHIVEAVRLDPSFVASVGKTYREQFTRIVDGVEILPLVVLDTKSAVLALDNENDNSEASAMMAALKQGFDGLPIWIIGHVAKPNIGRADVSGLSNRGASAIEGDANQTMFLIRESERRYLGLGKTRFEPRWYELEITSYTAQAQAMDEFGNEETITMRWGIASPAQQSRKETSEQAAELARKNEAAILRQDIRDAIELGRQLGNPLNRSGVKAKINRNNSEVVATIENLLNERWIHEVPVPSKERINNSKSNFLVCLTTEERDAVLRGESLPPEKLLIPKLWRKIPIPVVPESKIEKSGGED
jgi:RecA-family ATPase